MNTDESMGECGDGTLEGCFGATPCKPAEKSALLTGDSFSFSFSPGARKLDKTSLSGVTMGNRRRQVTKLFPFHVH